MNPYYVYIAVKTNNIREEEQLTYVVNRTNFKISIERSGHAKVTRHLDKADYEGGWLFPRQEKITFNSGTFGMVTDKILVKHAIENALQLNLRSV